MAPKLQKWRLFRYKNSQKSFCWICWMCSWRVSEKCASFSCNVEYVDYVECFLNLQTFPSAPQKTQHSTLAVRNTFFQKCVCFFFFFCCNVAYVECVLGLFLKMCFLGNVEYVEYVEYVECFWIYRPFQAQKTFNIIVVRKHIFSIMCLFAEMLNMLNVFLECFWKCVSFWGNVEYVEYVECFGDLQTPLEWGQ